MFLVLNIDYQENTHQNDPKRSFYFHYLSPLLKIIFLPKNLCTCLIKLYSFCS